MDKINYREEVLKVYPDAFVGDFGIGMGAIVIKTKVFFKLFSKCIGEPSFRENLVWLKCYEKLKSQGKIN